MKIAILFVRGGETLHRHVAELSEDSNLMSAGREAYDEFRGKFPDLLLWEDDIIVRYDKA